MSAYQAGQQAAMYAVAQAVSKGALPHIRTQTCVDCGAQADHYEHRDYNKPLDVEPVCRVCNNIRGPGIPRGTGITYTQGFGEGFVVTADCVRAATFAVVDFGDYESVTA